MSEWDSVCTCICACAFYILSHTSNISQVNTIGVDEFTDVLHFTSVDSQATTRPSSE